MQTTMNLLDEALLVQPVPYWTDKLQLSRSALHVARNRGNLSPAIAGALAEELGQDAKQWIVVAALESERESACKQRMLKKLTNAWKTKTSNMRNLYLPTARKVLMAWITHSKNRAPRHTVAHAPNIGQLINCVRV